MSHGLVTDGDVSREQLIARRSRPAHVVGAVSAEGVAVARLLRVLGFEQVVLHDMRPVEELRRAFRTTHGAYSRPEQDALWEQLRPLLEAARVGDAYLAGIDVRDTVVLGQGWYLDERNRNAVVAAVPDGTLVTSMTALYFLLAPGPIAAVTGTNGKSTTVALIDHLLEAGDIPHRTAGNERSNRQFLPEIEDLPPGMRVLLEVSNRQLLQLRRSPQVAAITALTPDHLEEHGGLAGYRAAKRRLFEHQGSEDVAIVNADDELALAAATASAGVLVRCGIGVQPAPSVCWLGDDLVVDGVPAPSPAAVSETGASPSTVRMERQVVATVSDLTVPGAHNLRNAAVAVAVALACGVEPAVIAVGLRTFAGKALRLEPLGELAPDVEIWSDIKSTTPEATIAAIEALPGRRLLLVVGGDDKGLDYAPLARLLADRGIATFAVPGSATDKLERAMAGSAPGLRRVETLADALELARADALPGDAVIVSPAAAGFWTTQLQGKPSLRTLVRRHRSHVPAS